MDVWGPAHIRGQGHERYFLLVVDDYSRYTTVFPLRSKGEVTEVLIDWIRAACLRLRESFGSDFPVLRLHSDRGGEFSSALLGAFCRAQGIRQTFTLPASPQQNGIAERRIGMVMDVARTSMIHVAAPHFLWPFAVQYAAHQLNLQPRVSLPETSPTLLWTGKVGDASAFRVWGSRAFVRDLSADRLSPRAVPCVFLGFPPDAPGWQFYHPTSRRVLSSQDVTFDELEHRTKHIALRYFLARELQQRGQLRLAYVASQANTADIFTKALPPGDHQRFCTMLDCVAWSKKHLFFALFDKEKTEMPYPTHNKWVTWAMNSAVWILSKVTHIFRQSAAQILVDKNLDLDTIAQLGQWDMNEMRRSYVTGIPRPAIQMQAGFSQEPGDYYIGRSKTKVPPKVLKAIKEHIFLKAGLWLIEAQEWNNEQDKEHMYYAAKSFLEALVAAQMPIAEDLAMYYVHCEDHPFDGISVCDCERHPYVQMSGFCKDEDSQKWALDVYTLNKYGIEMRTNPTMSRATDVSSHLNTKHLVTQLRAEINLHKEEGGKKEIQINHLEKQVESLEREKSSMKAELEVKTEVFVQLQKAFDALKNTAATSAVANVGESESVPQTVTEEATTAPQQAQQAMPSRQTVGSQLD
ncbi:unnamed protein product [Closterium sp. NIES-54]